jgi:hypothetical protein
MYLGIFCAPAIVFFAITGALQTFSLHETTKGSNYTPPKIIAQLSQLHKKQNLEVPAAKLRPPAPEADKSESHKDKPEASKPVAPAPAPAPAKNLLPMKLFFLLVSISLLLSTITGLYMSYTYIRNKTAVTATLIAGTVIPILLTLV